MKIVTFWCDKCDFSWIETNQNEVRRWKRHLNHEWHDTTNYFNEDCDNEECVYSVLEPHQGGYEKWLLQFDLDKWYKTSREVHQLISGNNNL